MMNDQYWYLYGLMTGTDGGSCPYLPSLVGSGGRVQTGVRGETVTEVAGPIEQFRYAAILHQVETYGNC